jgi:hypothetical protein
MSVASALAVRGRSLQCEEPGHLSSLTSRLDEYVAARGAFTSGAALAVDDATAGDLQPRCVD